MSQNKRAELLILCTTILAAAGWIFSKQAIQGLPPFGFIGLRFLFASLLLLPFCYRSFFQVSLKNIFKAMLVGCLLGGALLVWIYAISISDTLGEGAFIMSLSMLLVPLVSWPVFGIKPARSFWMSLPFALVGLILLSLSGGWHQSTSQVWFLIAAILLALQFNLNSHYAQRLPTVLLTCIQLFCIGIMGLFVSLLVEHWPDTIEVDIWLWFAESVVIATCLRFVMQISGQKQTSAENAAIIMVLEPVWTVFLSILWYGEKMPFQKIMGCMLILFSLFLYRGWNKLQVAFR